VLLFDGGMGTYFGQKSHSMGSSCELSNLSQPDLIRQIHKEYLEAGSQAIKTNTFAANRIQFQGDAVLTSQIIQAGWQLAVEAATPYDAYVFADIGPVFVPGEGESDKITEEYCWIADCFLKLGARHFLFETNAVGTGLKEVAAYIKKQEPEAFLIVSFAVGADGFSREGLFAADLIRSMADSPYIDAVGFNCSCGARHMLELAESLNREELQKWLSLMPNAGYPVVRNNRTFYEGDPVYFASQIREMARAGARILGGCCGTTPVHIREIRKMLEEADKDSGEEEPISQENRDTKRKIKPDAKQERKPEINQEAKLETKQETKPDKNTGFWDKLTHGEKVVAVELDPPADVMLDRFMKGAAELKAAGADIITIADCPIGRARMDASLLACKVKRELSIDTLPHMTCRDRNLNATKALLLGLYAEEIRNVLLVTGDPIPTAERDEVKSVYQFHSRKLAAFVSQLGENLLPSPFHLFGALDVNAPNFDIQLRLAKEKQENGIIGFLTQPILTPQAFHNLQKARKELSGYILGGIIPIVSQKNASYMNSEINGIRVDPQIIAMYAGKDRAAGEELAIKISVEIARQIAPYVDGYYLMTPFGRTGLIARILDEMKPDEFQKST
jgi:homocysteine S-methyltransferase